MKTLIVDTSVFAKWLNQTNEKYIDQADQILRDIQSGHVEVIVPELIKYEISNVLLKGKELLPEQAHISLGTAYSMPVTFVIQSEQQARETYSIAHDLGISYYDASFMSLAKQLDATLITDNIKHQGKAADIKVLPLSDYSPSSE